MAKKKEQQQGNQTRIGNQSTHQDNNPASFF